MTEIFPKLRDKNYSESYNSPYSFRSLKREIIDKMTEDEFKKRKEDCMGLTMREAMTIDEVRDFFPAIFVDEVIMLGIHEQHARATFNVTPQSTGDQYTQRFREKTTTAQIVREEDEIKHSKSDLEKLTQGFNKVIDWPIWSFERLLDSPLADTADEITLSTSKIWRAENQLAWHRLTQFSEGALDTKWANHVPLAGTDSTSLQAAMETAYLELTTAIVDRFDQSTLTWLLSPTTYTTLYADANFRRFDILGQSPNFLTGTLPNIQGIPFKIIEPGYFKQNLDGAAVGPSEFVSAPNDIYLVASRFVMNIRERVALRLDQTTQQSNQTQGVQIWERLGMQMRHPKAYRRISTSQKYSKLIADMGDILIRPQSDA